jgi:putative PIN family toxin of toxin-antitoxin system
MITAVLDTNVLVPGFAKKSGPPSALVDLWLAQRFKLIISEIILAELDHAWSKPYWAMRFSPEDIRETTTFLRIAAEVTSLSLAVKGVATHPADDLILATAVSANADYLVTGDKPLLAIGYYEGIPILSPREFLTILEQTEE